MLSDEEREAIEIVKGITEDDLLNYWEGSEEPYNAIQIILNLIEKQQKEIEELKREKETNQQMIHLAETQILGYGQGYKDGLNKETTATEIVARERENQIIYEGIKHKINMEWVLKIKAKTIEIKNRPVKDEFITASQGKLNTIIDMESLLEKE